jgi:methyl-accepting chemotaxis protein
MKKLSSLKFIILLFFTVFLIVLCSILTSMGLSGSYMVTSAIFSHEGVGIVERVVSEIDGDAFEALSKSLDADDPFYMESHIKLLQAKNDSTALYLYTMAPVSGTIYRFIIDGSAPMTDKKHFSPLGAEQDTSNYEDAFRETWEAKASRYSSVVFDEDIGYLVSVYTPIINSRGQMVGVLGCDFDANTLHAMISSQILRQVILAVVFAIAGVGMMVFFMNMIFSRLGNIRAILEEISQGQGDLTKRITIRRMDEIGVLANFFNLTLDKIRNLVVTI